MQKTNQHKVLRDQVVMVGVTVIALLVFCYFSGISLIVPLLLAFFGLHLFFVKKSSPRTFLHLVLLLVLLMFAAHVLKAYAMISPFYLPIAAIPMLTMLLFNDVQLAFMMAFMSAALSGLLLNYQLGEMLVFLLGGLAGAYKVKDARTRGTIITAGFFVSIVQLISFLAESPILTKDIAFYVIKPLVINGVLAAFVVIATSKVFESLFGELTNFTLLELSDSSHPLLKRMVIEAPGSYHHSLIVSNLSEAAADAIGANALLTRVGAYYHDIGKMVKPEYFTENQLAMGNVHDDLEPSMSRLVILNHIKEGVELARKYKLNQKIIDFIPEHHGTSLIHYFYQRALTESDPQQIMEDQYRYPGPKPQSKETAIVLLADSAEGATRALDEHTPQKIGDIVRKVINNKFIDGQLDECNLTLREIDTIANTFVRVLSAMYHSRVKYPESKDGHNSKKSAKDNPNSSSSPHPGSNTSA